MKKIVANYALAAVFTLVAVATAKAETVVWYTFDDLGDVGTRLSDSSTIQNRANPGTYDATVYGIRNGYIPYAASVNLPYVTNGVPEFTRMWDPVSGASASGTDRALRFPATIASGQGALLEVAADASLRPESFTAEALFRYPDPNWDLNANGWNRLVVMPNDAGYAWEIVVRWNNQIGFHFMVNDGSVTNRDWVVAPASGNWNDCKWHHVALSVEQGETTSTVKMYLDYVLKATKTLNYRISYSSSDLPLQIGGSSKQACLGNFCGELGEFRFSNTALIPAQFLRPRSTAARANFDPDCVLYYDFEDFSEDWSWFAAALGEVVNKADPGIMGGTIVTNTLAPEFVEDSPVERLRQSMTAAAYETSEKSLENYIVSADSRRNGYVECMPLDVDWFSKTNFTVECFFKTENMTQIYTPLFRRWGGVNVQVNIGVGGSGGRMGINISTNALTKQTERNISAFTAGTWNHVALVVDQIGETKTLKTYFNRNLIETFPLPSNLADTNANGASGPKFEKWFVAGADGGNSFDGKVDSMRVTLRALTPDEFLSIKKFPVDRTLAHVSFNDGTVNADPEGGTMVAGVNAAARNGGAAATFSGNVPGAIIRDGENGEIITKENTKSLSLSGSLVKWGSSSDDYGDTYFIRRTLAGDKRTSWTVEFWMKPDSDTPNWGRLLTATAVDEMNNYYPYALTITDARRLSLRALPTPGGVEEGSGNDNRIDWDLVGVNIFDGKWHHVAFTYAPSSEDPTKSEVKFYVDYGNTFSGTRTAKILIEYPERLVMRMGQGSSTDYKGLIDEFRISDGALEPSQFLRAENAPGLTIVVW